MAPRYRQRQRFLGTLTTAIHNASGVPADRHTPTLPQSHGPALS